MSAASLGFRRAVRTCRSPACDGGASHAANNGHATAVCFTLAGFGLSAGNKKTTAAQSPVAAIDEPAPKPTEHLPIALLTNEFPQTAHDQPCSGGPFLAFDLSLAQALSSRCVTPSARICNICQKRSFRLCRLPQRTRAHSGNPAFRRPSVINFAFDRPPRAIHEDIVKAGSISSRRAAASRVSPSRPRWAKAEARTQQAPA